MEITVFDFSKIVSVKALPGISLVRNCLLVSSILINTTHFPFVAPHEPNISQLFVYSEQQLSSLHVLSEVVRKSLSSGHTVSEKRLSTDRLFVHSG